MTIYLYIKTHNKTGLKYFGKTILEDYHSYKGSGTYWHKHNEKHGWDYSTQLVEKFDDAEEAKRFSVKFSIENDIVNSNDWANLKIEDISGGWDHINGENRQIYIEKGLQTIANWPEEYREQVRKAKSERTKGKNNPMYGRDRSGEKNPRYGAKVRGTETAIKIGNGNRGKKRTQEVKDKQSEFFRKLWREGVFDNRRKPTKEELKNWTQSSKGTRWWTDGEKSVRAKECPGPEWRLGRILKKKD